MNKIKHLIQEALLVSGRMIKKNINKRKQLQYKGTIDLVTSTDKAIENTVKRLINKTFPEHIICAEESVCERDAAAYRWIIDPIDGTTNFYHTYPMVCTSIAVEHNGMIVIGGVYDPLRDELFLAERGKGAFLNKKRIRVSAMPTLGDSLLASGFPYDRREHADYYLRFFKAFMLHCHGVRRGGSAALDLCYVACGRLDGFWELKLKPWDVAAGSLIVEEAGGRITDFKSDSYDIYGIETLASNGLVHEEMRQVIQAVSHKL